MTLQLTTQQLDYLVAAAEAASSVEAAELLGVTPSALSQGLAELERRLGVPLFEREGRNRVFTDYGHEVLEYAKRMVGLTADLATWAETARKGETGRVHVGLIDVAAVHHFAQPLTSFQASRIQADFHLTVAASATLLQQVRSAKLDAAVIVEPPAPVDGVTTRPLLVDEMTIYPPPGASVGRPRTWGPWVGFPPDSHTRQLIARWLKRLGSDYQVTAESHQPEVLRRMVALGMGWAVLPVIQAETEPAPLQRATSAPSLRRDLVIVKRERSVIGPATQVLLGLLMDHAARITSA